MRCQINKGLLYPPVPCIACCAGSVGVQQVLCGAQRAHARAAAALDVLCQQLNHLEGIASMAYHLPADTAAAERQCRVGTGIRMQGTLLVCVQQEVPLAITIRNNFIAKASMRYKRCMQQRVLQANAPADHHCAAPVPPQVRSRPSTTAARGRAQQRLSHLHRPCTRIA